MTHVRSSAGFLGSLAPCVRGLHDMPVYAYIYIYTYIRAFTSPPFSPVDIDGGHNAETNRVPRRIYMHASERSGVRAYRLVSIYARPGVSTGRSIGPGRRDRPHCPLDEHCAPALEPSGFSLLVSLVLLIRLCFCHFLFSNVARSNGPREKGKEREKGGRGGR